MDDFRETAAGWPSFKHLSSPIHLLARTHNLPGLVRWPASHPQLVNCPPYQSTRARWSSNCLTYAHCIPAKTRQKQAASNNAGYTIIHSFILLSKLLLLLKLLMVRLLLMLLLVSLLWLSLLLLMVLPLSVHNTDIRIFKCNISHFTPTPIRTQMKP